MDTGLRAANKTMPGSGLKHRIQISEELWSLIQPLLPAVKRSPKGGRPRLDDRRALNGIVFVLSTGIPWEDLPQAMGCGSGMTCWRRLRDWQETGVWQQLLNCCWTSCDRRTSLI